MSDALFVEQRVEWQFAFDIHCNSFFILFLFLYVLQVHKEKLHGKMADRRVDKTDDVVSILLFVRVVLARAVAHVRLVRGTAGWKPPLFPRLGILHVYHVPGLHGCVGRQQSLFDRVRNAD